MRTQPSIKRAPTLGSSRFRLSPRELHDSVDDEDESKHHRRIKHQRLSVPHAPMLRIGEPVGRSFAPHDVEQSPCPHKNGGDPHVEHPESEGIRVAHAGLRDHGRHSDRNTESLRTSDSQRRSHGQRRERSQTGKSGTQRHGPRIRSSDSNGLRMLAAYPYGRQKQSSAEQCDKNGNDCRVVLAVAECSDPQSEGEEEDQGLTADESDGERSTFDSALRTGDDGDDGTKGERAARRNQRKEQRSQYEVVQRRGQEDLGPCGTRVGRC